MIFFLNFDQSCRSEKLKVQVQHLLQFSSLYNIPLNRVSTCRYSEGPNLYTVSNYLPNYFSIEKLASITLCHKDVLSAWLYLG